MLFAKRRYFKRYAGVAFEFPRTIACRAVEGGCGLGKAQDVEGFAQPLPLSPLPKDFRFLPVRQVRLQQPSIAFEGDALR